MTDIAVTIRVTGPGTQPAASDGAEPDILQMPDSMETYSAPLLPEPEEVTGLGPALELLSRLQARLQDHRVEGQTVQIDLNGLDAANLTLIDQVLGEGDAWKGRLVGEKVAHRFPSGPYEFIVGDEQGIGRTRCARCFRRCSSSPTR